MARLINSSAVFFMGHCSFGWFLIDNLLSPCCLTKKGFRVSRSLESWRDRYFDSSEELLMVLDSVGYGYCRIYLSDAAVKQLMEL